MHPTLHRSILVLYVREPSKTSGARYHSVTTCPVSAQASKRWKIYWNIKLTSLLKVLTGTPNALAKPKSPILSSPLRLMSRFWGLRSRCNTRFSWQNAIPYSHQPRPLYTFGEQATHIQELICKVLDGVHIQRSPISMRVHVFLQILLTELKLSARLTIAL